MAADGGVFAFGGASLLGSTGAGPPRPDRGHGRHHDGSGYELVAADGGVFAFGSAVFEGSMGGRPLRRPVVGIVGS